MRVFIQLPAKTAKANANLTNDEYEMKQNKHERRIPTNKQTKNNIHTHIKPNAKLNVRRKEVGAEKR